MIKPNRFWQLQLSTAVVLMLVGGGLLGLNLRQDRYVVDQLTDRDSPNRDRNPEHRDDRSRPLCPAGHTFIEVGRHPPRKRYLRADVERLQVAGANAILVGEALMRADDIVAATRTLLGSQTSE